MATFLLVLMRQKKLGIKNIKKGALKTIRSELSASNLMQELFSSFAARWAFNDFIRFLPA